MLDVGETIERYEVEELLGTGGIAAVYRVRHRQLGTPHALKVLLVTTPVDRERLLAEGQVQARLKHPNVIAVTDVLIVNRSPALVMELVNGPSLDVWLAEGRVPPDVGMTLFRGVVAGIGAAHAVGLVHRDLKPSNVLVGRNSMGAMALKVTDFGLVRLLGTASPHTKTGTAIGTPAYMAPEQIRDPSGVDARADLWALGCLLYEMVCGRRAFPMEDPFALYEAIAAGRYEDPGRHAPNAPPRVLATIGDLLQVDRELRIRSCAALWTRLWDDPVPDDLGEGRTPIAFDSPLTLAGQTPEPVARFETTSTPGRSASVAPVIPAPVIPAPLGPDRPSLWIPIVAGLFCSAFACLGVVTWPSGAASSEASANLVPVAPRPVVAPKPVSEPDAIAQPVPSREVPPPEANPEPIAAPARVAAALPSAALPPAAGPEVGRVRIQGDAHDVWLEAGGVRFAVGNPVPVGTYTVSADWGDGRAGPAGRVAVAAGREITLRCASFVYACTVLPREGP